MPFELGSMEERDIPAWGRIDAAAMAQWPAMQAMNQHDLKGEPREKMVEEYTRANFAANGENVWLKVTDTETGEVVAGAFWRIRAKPQPEVIQEPPAPAENEGAVPQQFGLSVMRAMKPISIAFMNENVRGRPHLYLQILATHPDHQRRGAADLLVKWGCDEADRRGILACMMSSPSAWRLYQKHGFEVVTQVDMDMRCFGIEEPEVRRGMLRQPKMKQ